MDNKLALQLLGRLYSSEPATVFSACTMVETHAKELSKSKLSTQTIDRLMGLTNHSSSIVKIAATKALFAMFPYCPSKQYEISKCLENLSDNPDIFVRETVQLELKKRREVKRVVQRKLK